jgi:cephalosporin hydroxylase
LERTGNGRGAATLRPPAPIWQSTASVVDEFHRMYWDSKRWATQWMGHNVLKSPMDLMVYAELIHKRRPDVLIETGTWNGGSALFFAHCMDIIGKGCVVTIDRALKPNLPKHPRILYVEGDSADMATSLDLEPGWTVMAALDSGHSKDHVTRELAVFKDIVTVDQYLVVEDTNLNGHPVFDEHGPGPFEAVQEFSDARFRIDEALGKRHLFSMHTWLVKEAA